MTTLEKSNPVPETGNSSVFAVVQPVVGDPLPLEPRTTESLCAAICRVESKVATPQCMVLRCGKTLTTVEQSTPLGSGGKLTALVGASPLNRLPCIDFDCSDSEEDSDSVQEACYDDCFGECGSLVCAVDALRSGAITRTKLMFDIEPNPGPVSTIDEAIKLARLTGLLVAPRCAGKSWLSSKGVAADADHLIDWALYKSSTAAEQIAYLRSNLPTWIGRARSEGKFLAGNFPPLAVKDISFVAWVPSEELLRDNWERRQKEVDGAHGPRTWEVTLDEYRKFKVAFSSSAWRCQLLLVHDVEPNPGPGDSVFAACDSSAVSCVDGISSPAQAASSLGVEERGDTIICLSSLSSVQLSRLLRCIAYYGGVDEHSLRARVGAARDMGLLEFLCCLPCRALRSGAVLRALLSEELLSFNVSDSTWAETLTMAKRVGREGRRRGQGASAVNVQHVERVHAAAAATRLLHDIEPNPGPPSRAVVDYSGPVVASALLSSVAQTAVAATAGLGFATPVAVFPQVVKPGRPRRKGNGGDSASVAAPLPVTSILARPVSAVPDVGLSLIDNSPVVILACSSSAVPDDEKHPPVPVASDWEREDCHVEAAASVPALPAFGDVAQRVNELLAGLDDCYFTAESIKLTRMAMSWALAVLADVEVLQREGSVGEEGSCDLDVLADRSSALAVALDILSLISDDESIAEQLFGFFDVYDVEKDLLATLMPHVAVQRRPGKSMAPAKRVPTSGAKKGKAGVAEVGPDAAVKVPKTALEKEQARSAYLTRLRVRTVKQASACLRAGMPKRVLAAYLNGRVAAFVNLTTDQIVTLKAGLLTAFGLSGDLADERFADHGIDWSAVLSCSDDVELRSAFEGWCVRHEVDRAEVVGCAALAVSLRGSDARSLAADKFARLTADGRTHPQPGPATLAPHLALFRRVAEYVAENGILPVRESWFSARELCVAVGFVCGAAGASGGDALKAETQRAGVNWTGQWLTFSRHGWVQAGCAPDDYNYRSGCSEPVAGLLGGSLDATATLGVLTLGDQKSDDIGKGLGVGTVHSHLTNTATEQSVLLAAELFNSDIYMTAATKGVWHKTAMAMSLVQNSTGSRFSSSEQCVNLLYRGLQTISNFGAHTRTVVGPNMSFGWCDAGLGVLPPTEEPVEVVRETWPIILDGRSTSNYSALETVFDLNLALVNVLGTAINPVAGLAAGGDVRDSTSTQAFYNAMSRLPQSVLPYGDSPSLSDMMALQPLVVGSQATMPFDVSRWLFALLRDLILVNIRLPMGSRVNLTGNMPNCALNAVENLINGWIMTNPSAVINTNRFTVSERDLPDDIGQVDFYLTNVKGLSDALRSYSVAPAAPGNWQDLFGSETTLTGETVFVPMRSQFNANQSIFGAELVRSITSLELAPQDCCGNFSHLAFVNNRQPAKRFVLVFDTVIPNEVSMGNFKIVKGAVGGPANIVAASNVLQQTVAGGGYLTLPVPTSVFRTVAAGYSTDIAAGDTLAYNSYNRDPNLIIQALTELSTVATKAMVDKAVGTIAAALGKPVQSYANVPSQLTPDDGGSIDATPVSPNCEAAERTRAAVEQRYLLAGKKLDKVSLVNFTAVDTLEVLPTSATTDGDLNQFRAEIVTASRPMNSPHHVYYTSGAPRAKLETTFTIDRFADLVAPGGFGTRCDHSFNDLSGAAFISMTVPNSLVYLGYMLGFYKRKAEQNAMFNAPSVANVVDACYAASARMLLGLERSLYGDGIDLATLLVATGCAEWEGASRPPQGNMSNYVLMGQKYKFAWERVHGWIYSGSWLTEDWALGKMTVKWARPSLFAESFFPPTVAHLLLGEDESLERCAGTVACMPSSVAGLMIVSPSQPADSFATVDNWRNTASPFTDVGDEAFAGNNLAAVAQRGQALAVTSANFKVQAQHYLGLMSAGVVTPVKVALMFTTATMNTYTATLLNRTYNVSPRARTTKALYLAPMVFYTAFLYLPGTDMQPNMVVAIRPRRWQTGTSTFVDFGELSITVPVNTLEAVPNIAVNYTVSLARRVVGDLPLDNESVTFASSGKMTAASTLTQQVLATLSSGQMSSQAADPTRVASVNQPFVTPAASEAAVSAGKDV